MPTRVEEARARVMCVVECYHDSCSAFRDFESAIREEERVKADYEAQAAWKGIADRESENLRLVIQRHEKALRAEKVRVLEEVIGRWKSRFYADDELRDLRHLLDDMLSSARAEGAPEMVDERGRALAGGKHATVASATHTRPETQAGPESRPPSEEPEPGGARIPLTDEALTKLKEGARRSTRLTGKDMAVTVGPVPEPGGGRCPKCGYYVGAGSP